MSNIFTYIMSRLGVNESALSLAVSKSRSLRTTVPLHIVEQMELGEGDVVLWKLDKMKSGEWVATVKKKT